MQMSKEKKPKKITLQINAFNNISIVFILLRRPIKFTFVRIRFLKFRLIVFCYRVLKVPISSCYRVLKFRLTIFCYRVLKFPILFSVVWFLKIYKSSMMLNYCEASINSTINCNQYV